MQRISNFEKIKGMNVEELAEIFEDKVSSFDCDVCSSEYAGMDICGERGVPRIRCEMVKGMVRKRV